MKKIFYLLSLSLLFINVCKAQTQMPLPPHGSVYAGIYARGYWFIAPTNFTITGLMVAPEAGSGLQYIHLMKCHDPFPVPTSGSTNFTTLAYISGAANNTMQSVNISVNTGDTIGVLGTVTGISNSYSATGSFTTTIAGMTVNITRMGYQGSIETGPAPEYWGFADGAAGELGRVFIEYTTGPCIDPPTPGTATASTTLVCSGAPLNLSLSGNSGGIGQTHVWEISVLGGPFTPISSSSASPNYTINPTANAAYRAAVTCGTSTTYSTPISITISQNISGTFTIDKTQPAGGGNFTSFASALAFLNCGVGGPVTFNVAPNSGPYTEQLTIGAIPGVSATSPVVINGNGNTINFSPVSATRHIIKLDGADYFTLDSLNIVSLSATYGWGIHLINGADYNTISRCNIDMSAVTSTSADNGMGIAATNSSTVEDAAGNNGNYNTFIGNTISGAYRCVCWVGNPTGLNAVGNSFINNTVQEFYADGFYLVDNDGTSITGNNFQRPTRTNETTGAAVEANTGNRNLLIKGNRIHDTHTNASSGTFYGVFFDGCDAPVGMENKVINNLLYKFNSSGGTIYALYNSNSDGAWYHHNTVALDHAAATGGTTRGVFQTGAASNIQYKNNIVYITRGGTGTKYTMYFATSTSSIISNNNDLYISAPAGSNSIGYFGGAQSTLTNWKAVNSSAYDQQSVSLNPTFANAAGGDYTPTNVALDNVGQPLAVSTDLLGNPRSGTTPDVGSIEFLTVPSPLAVRLSAFAAERNGPNVLVSWSVGQEEGVAEYVIERSFDGSSFNEVGKMNAGGKSSYSFTDRNAVSAAINNRLYYRLRMVESNGKIAFSNIALVSLNMSDQSFSVYPNPFAESISIMVKASQSGTCILTIKDVTGRTVVTQAAALIKGANQVKVNGLGKLAHGSYTLVTDINGSIEKTTLVK